MPASTYAMSFMKEVETTSSDVHKTHRAKRQQNLIKRNYFSPFLSSYFSCYSGPRDWITGYARQFLFARKCLANGGGDERELLSNSLLISSCKAGEFIVSTDLIELTRLNECGRGVINEFMHINRHSIHRHGR